MFIKRDISETLKRFSKFPVVVILGPRQSGKTTIAQETFKNHTYISLEDPELLTYITNDPKGFLREYENEHGIIFDEFQHAPKLLSYIQIESDAKDRPGYFVLTSSQNFLMNQEITQTLAGRAGILNLLPLSIHELIANKIAPDAANELIVNGCYPRLYAKDFLPQELFPSYIHTYVERDVCQLINVENLHTFQKFMMLCAGRIGQQLNVADIAITCNIDERTTDQWLSLLEANYIIFMHKPHFNNFNKRVTKTPKLFFYDTGLACSLLGIRTPQELNVSPFKDALFESLIIADFYKQYYNAGLEPSLYFWRNKNGRVEIDCLVDKGGTLLPIEIKLGQTINNDFFDTSIRWSELSSTDPKLTHIVYAGDQQQKRSTGTVISWKKAGTLIESIERAPIE